jgi:spermidine synthase
VPQEPTLLRASLFALGFSAVVTQLTFMRELLGVFAGNELVFGVILGNWLLLTGLGSFGGRSAERLAQPVRFLAAAQVVLALLPLLLLAAVRVCRHYFFVRGATVEMTETVLSSFLILMPYCVLSGYLLTLACARMAESDDPSGVGRGYLWDGIGSVAGGVAFSFVLIPLANPFVRLFFPAFLFLFLSLAWARSLSRRGLLICSAAVALGLAAVALTTDLDGWTTRCEYAPQAVVFRGDSPYGRLVVTESDGQYNFFQNGVPFLSTGDPIGVEESVHYALAQRPDAQRVLLLSGGISGTAREILKWGVREVDYVELDPLLLEAGRHFLPEALDDPRLHVYQTDGREFVKRAAPGYDVILVNVPSPTTSQLNRYYTREFFAEAHRALAPGGVLAVSLGAYQNYVPPELARLYSVLYATLRTAFAQVRLIPGSARTWFLASDGEITLALAERLEARRIATVAFNKYFLQEILRSDRLADLERALDPQAVVNTDFSPVLYYFHLLYWGLQFQTRFGVLAGILAVLAVLFLWRIRAAPFAIFSAGFSASVLEVVLFLGFQVLHGSLYRQLGLLTAAFMAGLALGSWLMLRRVRPDRPRELAWVMAGLALLALLLPAALNGLSRAESPWATALSAYVAFPLLLILLAALVGLAFPLAARADFTEPAQTAARLYWADFGGACLGALVVSAFLIPVLGVAGVCYLTALPNLLAAAIWLLRKP